MKFPYIKFIGIGFNVIGRLDIFNRFKVCFDEEEKMVEFQTKAHLNTKGR
ncbi:MAG: hypothetical protein AB1567_07310 [bacterium]